MISSGEEKAWEILGGMIPDDVCGNASVSFDKACHIYTLKSFCTDFSIDPQKKVIKNLAPEGEILIKRYGYFFIHACLWYMVGAKDIPLTEKLIKPGDIKGGDLFLRGTHVLPLDKIAGKYGTDREGFIKKGLKLCGEEQDYGDASVRLLPLPRIPVTLVLWIGDDEFPPRADLLLDSSCQCQLPLDILWAVSMLTTLLFL